MVLMTIIARLADGLPLAASLQEDEQTGRNLQDYQAQAKQLFRKLNVGTPPQCTVETGPYLFHYLIADGVVYLTLTEREFSKKLAFSYLEELRSEFYVQYGTRIETVNRPYGFIEFDTYIQKARKQYTDSRARNKLSQVHTELHDVQRIMVQNIDDVLQRGVQMSSLDSKATALAEVSDKYRKDARFLNMKSSYLKIGAIVVFALLVLMYFRFWWM